MGYICHNAIVVTGMHDVHAAHRIAEDLLKEQGQHIDALPMSVLSPVSDTTVNGYRSFAIFPDGSKEGWSTSAAGDDFRDAFVRAIEDLWVEWCEVRFGDEADMNGMTRCSGEPPMLLPAWRKADEPTDDANGRKVAHAPCGGSACERVVTLFNELFDAAKAEQDRAERERNEARALVNRILTAPGPTYPTKPIDWNAE